MFSNLIESGSHEKDLKRKGSFFIGTFFVYGVLLMGASVGSIYAYNVKLDAENDYEISILQFPAQSAPVPEREEVAPRPAAVRAGGGHPVKVKQVVLEFVPNGQVAPEGSRVITSRTPFIIGDEDSPASIPGGSGADEGDGHGGTDHGRQPVVPITEDAPDIRTSPTPRPEPPRQTGPVRVPSSVLVGQAISKPTPPYPPIARQLRIQGTVGVQIVVDEQGKVVSARATSGPQLLIVAAEKAALQARFTPTVLSGSPVKVTGVITYNFVLQ